MTRVRAGVALAAGAALAALATGCGIATQELSDTDTGIGAGVREIRIAQDGGSVTVKVGETASVHREVRYWRGKPGATHRVEGDVLVLAGCESGCTVDYTVVLPGKVVVTGDARSGDLTVEAARSVALKVASGDVDIRGVDGEVAVETASGRAEVVGVGENARVEVGSGNAVVRDVSGDAFIRSRSGSITTSGVKGKVDAEAGSGDVTVDHGAVADVRARAGSGSVHVTVPSGRYRVATDVRSGSVDNAVANDPAGTAAIEAGAGSGNVTVGYR